MAVTIETLLLIMQRTSVCGVLNNKSNIYTVGSLHKTQATSWKEKRKISRTRGLRGPEQNSIFSGGTQAAQDLHKGKPVVDWGGAQTPIIIGWIREESTNWNTGFVICYYAFVHCRWKETWECWNWRKSQWLVGVRSQSQKEGMGCRWTEKALHLVEVRLLLRTRLN